MVTSRSLFGMYCDRMFRNVVLPAPVPPETRMLMRARTADDSTSIISAEMLFNCTSWLAASGPVPKRRIDIDGPSSASGGMMALTREPSGRRASTMGDDSSTLRPTRDTIRSMICIRCRSSRNDVSTFCSSPPFSINTWSLPFTRMSEILGSRSSGSSGPSPKTSSSRSAWIFSCSSKFSGTRWSDMISFTSPETAWRAWLEFTRDSFSRSSFEIRVR